MRSKLKGGGEKSKRKILKLFFFCFVLLNPVHFFLLSLALFHPSCTNVGPWPSTSSGDASFFPSVVLTCILLRSRHMTVGKPRTFSSWFLFVWLLRLRHSDLPESGTWWWCRRAFERGRPEFCPSSWRGWEKSRPDPSRASLFHPWLTFSSFRAAVDVCPATPIELHRQKRIINYSSQISTFRQPGTIRKEAATVNSSEGGLSLQTSSMMKRTAVRQHTKWIELDCLSKRETANSAGWGNRRNQAIAGKQKERTRSCLSGWHEGQLLHRDAVGGCVGRQTEGGGPNRVNVQTKNSRRRSRENRMIAFRDCELGVRTMLRLVFLLSFFSPLSRPTEREKAERGEKTAKDKKKTLVRSQMKHSKRQDVSPVAAAWEWVARSSFPDKLRSRKEWERMFCIVSKRVI